jgi:hypothetical protein
MLKPFLFHRVPAFNTKPMDLCSICTVLHVCGWTILGNDTPGSVILNFAAAQGTHIRDDIRLATFQHAALRDKHLKFKPLPLPILALPISSCIQTRGDIKKVYTLRLSSNNILLLHTQPAQDIVVQMQRILHHLRRCECHPLSQTHIFKLRRLQHLEQYHILISDILNVMPLVYEDIAHVPRSIIKRSC